MGIISMILAVLEIAKFLAQYIRDRKLQQAGYDKAISESLHATKKQLLAAREFLDNARNDYDPNDPKWVRDPNDRAND